MSTGRVLINGRVTARATITGVERYALEVIPRLQALAPGTYTVARPPAVASAGVLGHLWEQAVLPARAARVSADVVFSPANLAPLAWPRNVVVIHDAAVFRGSGAYSRSYRLLHQRLGALAARRALEVVTVSAFSARELVQALRLDPASVTVITGGVGSRFSAAEDPSPVLARYGLTNRYVLTIGTADERKNLAALSVAAERLKALGVDVVNAGDTRPQFAATATPPAIRSLGYVDEQDLPGLYRGASAFVLPSLYEGLGLPCLEAMASGVPVVASDRAALPETCGDAAILVDPSDHEAIAQALERVLQDEPLAVGLREAGLARAAQFTWERTAAQLHSLLTGPS